MPYGLFRHYFTIQNQKDFHGVEKSGAIHRSAFADHKINLPCNIQQMNRMDAETRYNIVVAEKLFVIYHKCSLLFDETYRVLVNKNDFRILSTIRNPDDVLILEYRGHKVPGYTKNKRLRVNEVYCEWNKRGVL